MGKTKPYCFSTFLTETVSLLFVFVSFLTLLCAYGWTYVHNTYVRFASPRLVPPGLAGHNTWCPVAHQLRGAWPARLLLRRCATVAAATVRF